MCTYFRSAKRFHRPAACTPQRQLRAINSSLSSSLSSRTLCGSLLFHQASQNKFIDQIQNTICKTLAKYCFDWTAGCKQKGFVICWCIIQNSLLGDLKCLYSSSAKQIALDSALRRSKYDPENATQHLGRSVFNSFQRSFDIKQINC